MTVELPSEVLAMAMGGGTEYANLTWAVKGFTTTVADYDMVEKVASGASATVYKAWHIPSGKLVALKVMKTAARGLNSREYISREVALHRRVAGHPNIVDLYAAFECPRTERFYMALEWVEGDDLFNNITERGVDATQARFIFAELLHALDHCHANGVLHADVKPENILLTDQGHVKLCDFGMGDTLGKPVPMRGTLTYLPPDALATRQLVRDRSTDVWAACVTLYAALTGSFPFVVPEECLESEAEKDSYSENQRESLLESICNQSYDVSDLSSSAVDLFARSFDTDKRYRLTSRELLQHRWVSGEHVPILVIPCRPSITRKEYDGVLDYKVTRSSPLMTLSYNDLIATTPRSPKRKWIGLIQKRIRSVFQRKSHSSLTACP